MFELAKKKKNTNSFLSFKRKLPETLLVGPRETNPVNICSASLKTHRVKSEIEGMRRTSKLRNLKFLGYNMM